MTLSPGTHIGSYEIVDAIGSGGMGEVYRATDTKLEREVAIKTLPSTLAGDTDRLARFEREAKLLAALNHPNIAVIYGLEEQDGTQCIAMELIEGATLEERLKDGPLPVEDALRLALQIGQALEAAHEKGVVHRDLKPANVMVTQDGLVKVLDFGLAKAFSDDPEQSTLGQSPALSLAMTQAGIVLGTASYMSPEQASGQGTDQRADVWGFGVVLFEMLSGLPLFTGESVPHILADVLKSEPDWNRLPKNLHPRLRQLLERCLEKKARNRYHGIADARVDIEKVLNDPEGKEAHPQPQIAAPQKSLSARLVATALPAVIAGVLVGLAVWMAMRPEPSSVMRFDYDRPEDQTYRLDRRRVLALSPDGSHFVYNTEDGLYLRPLDELEARLIPGTETLVTAPVFSPDGQYIAYLDPGPGQLKRIAVSGGAPVVIADVQGSLEGLSWAADGTIFFGGNEGIYRVPDTGGAPELVTGPDEGTIPFAERLLPDGDTLLLSLAPNNDWSRSRIVAHSLSTGEQKVLVEGGSDARYLPTGHLVYALGDVLFAVVFDLESLAVSGGPVPLVQGVAPAPGTGGANYGVSADGTLIYMSGSANNFGGDALVWVDRDGREESLDLESDSGKLNPMVSPDGTRVAMRIVDGSGATDIWVFSAASGALSRLTFETGDQGWMLWTPDGEQIVYFSESEGLFVRRADGTGTAEQLFERADLIAPMGWSADGQIVVSEIVNGSSDIGLIALDGTHTPLLTEPFDEQRLSVSPDGRWLAYESDETEVSQIYVRPLPDVDEGKWQISSDLGVLPKWSADGATLFFIGRTDMMAAPIQTDPTFSHGTAEAVMDRTGYNFGGGLNGHYDVAPDGRFLMRKRSSGESESDTDAGRIVVVLNWFEELERLAPTE